jgi:hypothetical protein
LKNSDLNNFIFADIGPELNGSTLTMLSMLARLGEDPWTEAAILAKLPKNEAFDYLLQGISKMPLVPITLADMRATASRLLLLLPGRTQTTAQTVSGTAGALTMPQWLPIVLICASLAFGMILNMLPASVTGITAPMPMAQTLTHATVAPASPAEPIPPQRN